MLTGAQFAAEYDLPGRYGIAGLVIYGGSNDGANPERCVSIILHTPERLGMQTDSATPRTAG